MARSTYEGKFSRHEFKSEPQLYIVDTGSAVKLCELRPNTTANLFDRPLGQCLQHARQFDNPLHGYTLSILTLPRQAKQPILER